MDAMNNKVAVRKDYLEVYGCSVVAPADREEILGTGKGRSWATCPFGKCLARLRSVYVRASIAQPGLNGGGGGVTRHWQNASVNVKHS